MTQFLPAAAAGVARQGQLRPQEERRGGKVAARSFTSEPRRPPGPRSARAEKEVRGLTNRNLAPLPFLLF